MYVEIYQTNLAEVHCLIHVDRMRQIIHVLDVNDDNTRSVTNGIEQIQPQIIQQHQLSGEVSNWKWILYGTDGIASLYNGNFHAAPTELINPRFEALAKKLSSNK